MIRQQSSPFAVRGVIEGFYGVYYTFPERNELIRFLGRHGFNAYVYGPKNDRQHRARWREPYPDPIMEQFAQSVRIAEDSGVTFCYSIGSGVSMSYASPDDFAIISTKFKAFYDIGVRAFGILLDDISSSFKHDADARAYRTFAEAHADVTNRLYGWLQELDTSCTLSLCPTDYHGVAPFSDYVFELGEKLHPDVEVQYTGPEICSPEILLEHAQTFGAAVRRRPVLWDNYPVNDLDMRSELHLGPIRRRDPRLHDTSRGFLVNLMSECEASKLALLTFADYFHDPHGYVPDRSWQRAILELCGERSAAPFRLFAEQSLRSCLGEPESVKLRQLADDALASLQSGGAAAGNPAVTALSDYLTEIDEACYHLKNRMDNLALRNNLLPWIEVMENWHWMAKRAILVLEALERGEEYAHPLGMMRESLDNIVKAPKRIADGVLQPFADYVLGRVAAAESGANGG